MATIVGSHGEIQINSITGQVVSITDIEGNPVDYYEQNTELLPGEVPANPDHSPIIINVAEWQKYHARKLMDTDRVDILDVGYITAGGEYDSPESHWREEMAKCAADENYLPFSDPEEIISDTNPKPRISIIMDGGVVQNILASEDMEITIVDYDKDGADPDELTEIFPGAFGYFDTFSPELNSPDLDAIFKVERWQRIPSGEEVDQCKKCRFFEGEGSTEGDEWKWKPNFCQYHRKQVAPEATACNDFENHEAE